jgi:hypothetical protein
LAELVAEAQDAFLGASAFLVAARPSECGVEAAFLQGVEQGARLLSVAGGAGARVGNAPFVDGLLDGRDDEPMALPGDPAIAELDDLVEVVAGVDVHDRERER